MTLDLEATLDAMDPVLFSGERDVAAGMSALVDVCQAKLPSPGWEALRARDWSVELPAIRRWFENVLAADPPPDEVEALFVGLDFPTRNDKKADAPVLYVAGHADYERDPWPDDPSWLPSGHSYDSSTLREVHEFLALGGDDVAELGEFVLLLGWTCLVAINLGHDVDRRLLLGDRDQRAVAVGFQGGSSVHLGWVDEEGAWLGEGDEGDGLD